MKLSPLVVICEPHYLDLGRSMENLSRELHIPSLRPIKLADKKRAAKNKGSERDFYKFAALLANPDTCLEGKLLHYPTHLAPKNHYISQFLDASYQEKSQEFIAQPCPVTAKHLKLKETAIKKRFMKQEGMSVVDFHSSLNHLIQHETWPLMMVAKKDGGEEVFLVHKARLFFAHRMHLKSMQIKGGASPLIRYFHAVFYEHESLKAIDVFYWLKFDGENQPKMGDFITNDREGYWPKALDSAKEVLSLFLKTK